MSLIDDLKNDSPSINSCLRMDTILSSLSEAEKIALEEALRRKNPNYVPTSHANPGNRRFMVSGDHIAKALKKNGHMVSSASVDSWRKRYVA